MVEKSENRLHHIDLLKAIGLSLVILAHANLPKNLLAVRTFDVPLLVIISAYLGERSFKKHYGLEGTIKYYAARVRRLLVPVWCFLLFFFVLIYMLFGTLYDVQYYLYSFCLTRFGINYVWIILIYLYAALLVPVFYKIGCNRRCTIAVAVIYVLYEIAFRLGWLPMTPLVDSTILEIIPYGALTYLGCNYEKMSQKTRLVLAGVFLSVFIVMAVYFIFAGGHFVSMQVYKYPPQIYYLAYGIGASLTLMIISEKLPSRLLDNALVRFLSVHSLGIYLWHILVLYLWEMMKFKTAWYIKYTAVYCVSILIAGLFNFILKALKLTIGERQR